MSFGKANRLWIPEMNQMIEIMHFLVSFVVIGVSGTSFLDAAQTSYHNRNTLKGVTTRSRSRNSQSSLLSNAGVFQEVDVA
jgi:hypothetical protein